MTTSSAWRTQYELDRFRDDVDDDDQPERPAVVCGHRPAGSHGVSCQQPAGHQGGHSDWHESWPRDESDEGEAFEDNRRGAADLHTLHDDDDLPF